MRGRLDQTVLRRCIRAAVVLPALFFLGVVVLDDANMSVFLSFGAMGHLVFGDYGGTPRRRTLAYLATTVAGAVIIALATLLSGSAIPAAIGTAVGTFTIAYAGVLGDVASELVRPLTLAFILAVAVRATPADVALRMLAWTTAGLVSLAAATLLPRPPPPHVLRAAIATACRALAASLAPGAGPSADGAAQRAADAARAAQSHRPTAELEPVRDSQAMALVVEEMTVTGILLDEYRAAPASRPCPDAEATMVAAAAAVLAASATAIEADERRSVPLAVLDTARAEHRQALEEWLAERADGGQAPEKIIASIEATRPARALAYTALGIGGHATVINGGRLATTWRDTPPPVPAIHDVGELGRRELRVVARNFSPSSSRFRISARQGVALGLALGLVGVLSLNHGFWAALATFAVLRSNALGTGRAVGNALAGTLGGFVIAAVLLTVVGEHHLALWLILVPLTFAVAAAPDLLGFGGTQALFTVFVVVLFDIISLEGVRIGETRVIDVLLGCGVAAVVGLVTWPHGARQNLQRILGHAYHAAGAALASSADAARTVRVWLARTHDVFAEYQQEAGAKQPSIDVWASLVGGLQLVEPLADRINRLPAATATTLPRCAETVRRHEQAVSVLFDGVGDQLLTGAPAPEPPSWPVGAALEDHDVFATEASRRAAIPVMWADDALADLVRVGRLLTGPAEQVWATPGPP
jgi:uncharacterized membrane protein YccC